jgi:hypothetical protein
MEHINKSFKLCGLCKSTTAKISPTTQTSTTIASTPVTILTKCQPRPCLNGAKQNPVSCICDCN